MFERRASVWTQQAYIKASNTDANDQFGVSVAISGDTVVVGALGEGSNATGVNGDENNNSAQWSGAAYVFDLPAASSTTVGAGCIASGTAPSLSASAPAFGQAYQVTVSDASANAPGFLIFGFAHPGMALFTGCTAYVDLNKALVLLPFTTDALGGWQSSGLSVGNPSMSWGSKFGLQAGIEGAGTWPLGVALTNGVCLLYTSPSPRDKRQSRMPSSA